MCSFIYLLQTDTHTHTHTHTHTQTRIHTHTHTHTQTHTSTHTHTHTHTQTHTHTHTRTHAPFTKQLYSPFPPLIKLECLSRQTWRHTLSPCFVLFITSLISHFRKCQFAKAFSLKFRVGKLTRIENRFSTALKFQAVLQLHHTRTIVGSSTDTKCRQHVESQERRGRGWQEAKPTRETITQLLSIQVASLLLFSLPMPESWRADVVVILTDRGLE